jgi:peptide/nickel transport system substrate-binding protein
VSADRRAGGWWLLLTLVGLAVAAPVPAPAVESRTGALVDRVVFTQESDVGKVAGLIETGTHQVFAQGVANTTVFQRLRDSTRVGYAVAYGSSMELTVNPVGPHFATGELNPFHVPAMREALNWLINRRHVAEELYGGLAVPRYLPLNTVFPDYARLADVARALELRYRHDPARAAAVIEREMQRLGAVRERGTWTYQGSAVRVSVLIRTEDARRRVGDYVANLLEDLGFRVERLYRSAEEASRIWIAGDPHAGRWHLYTGGWISTVINRDLADTFSFYYTARGRPEPLWQTYQPDPELDLLADRLQRRDYVDAAQRREWMARALELAMADSVRIWVVDQLNIAPHSSEIELAADLAGGIAGSRLWPYTLRYRDRVGGSVVIAVPSVLTEPWNPVAGSNWIFDTMIQRAIEDVPLIPDPFTGLYWPQRIVEAAVTVQAGAAVARSLDWLSLETVDTIVVPEAAWIDWDSATERFVSVAERHPAGLTARTRVRVRYEDGYLDRTWHDGSRMSLADVLLPWILGFERADAASALYDPAHVPTFEVFKRHFRGWHIVSSEPLIIEIYSDQVFPDAETLVAARAPSVTPWHMLALGIRAEVAGELAFSSNKADRERLTWLNLVAGPSLAVLDRHRDAALVDERVPFPATLGALLAPGEAIARFRAISDWRDRHGHYLLGDGPFLLHSVHPLERVVVLHRNPDFSDPADKWLRFTTPAIPVLEPDGPIVVSGGESAEFTLRVSIDGQPYPLESIEHVRYLLFDGDGVLARAGELAVAGDGLWRLQLDADALAALGSGANSLELAVISRLVALPAFASHVFATVPARGAGPAPVATDG